MGETALAQRARQTFLDRTNQSRGAVNHGAQQVLQSAPAQILEERAGALGLLLGAWRESQQYLFPLATMPQAHSTASCGSPGLRRSAIPSK
jgi:hypothetical protein